MRRFAHGRRARLDLFVKQIAALNGTETEVIKQLGRYGQLAAPIRKRRIAHMRGYPQWRWHLDEVFVKVNGKLCYLWRAVDHEGEVLEAVATAKRDKAAALKLLKRIMKKYGTPRSIVTDGLRAYSAAMNEIGVASVRRKVGGRLNNRAENSHSRFGDASGRCSDFEA